MPNTDALLRELDNPGFNAREVALLNTRADGLDANADRSVDQVEISKYDSLHPEAKVRTSGQSLVVFSEVFYPGWIATVNGAERPIVEVDGALRGVVVPAGESQVQLRYRPMSILAGSILTTFTFAGIGLWAFFSRRTAIR
jgi:uncharacterized membrane protein YfhO